MSHTMEIQRRRVPDWVHAPETSPPLEHARHVQSLNAISCIPSVTCVLFLLEINLNCSLFITYPKQENNPKREAALQSVKESATFPC
jgi:hypothetical protein